MKLVIKFLAAFAFGYGVAMTEDPIHKMEKEIAGNAGVSEWYLITRYILGFGVLQGALIIFMMHDDSMKMILADETMSSDEKLNVLIEHVAKANFAGAVGVGSGVGVNFALKSFRRLQSGE